MEQAVLLQKAALIQLNNRRKYEKKNNILRTFYSIAR